MKWFSSPVEMHKTEDNAETARAALQQLFSSSAKHISLPTEGFHDLEDQSNSKKRNDTQWCNATENKEKVPEDQIMPLSSLGQSETVGWRAPPGEPKEINSSRLHSPLFSSKPLSSSSLSPSRPLASWTDLPPCPIAGYRLTQEGLWDDEPTEQSTTTVSDPLLKKNRYPDGESTKSSWFSAVPTFFSGSSSHPPRVAPERRDPVLLSASALKEVIHELRRLEQEAKMQVDEQLPDQVRTRSLHGLELAVNPCLLLTGIYLMTWKSAQLYRCAIPRHSVILTKLLSIMRWHLSAREKEEVAKRHRRFMQATNTRVSLCFSAGVSLTGFALWTRPSSLNVDTTPDAERGKKVVAYQQHTSASLKWMWFVYYHHPAYRSAAQKDHRSLQL